jgi:hypothetical protein
MNHFLRYFDNYLAALLLLAALILFAKLLIWLNA